jgi:hypothetical protein
MGACSLLPAAAFLTHIKRPWLIYFGDVLVGRIMRSVGNPGAAPKWEWRCGFYPGSDPGECKNGTAATFDKARAAFEAAWRMFMSKRADEERWGMSRTELERRILRLRRQDMGLVKIGRTLGVGTSVVQRVLAAAEASG